MPEKLTQEVILNWVKGTQGWFIAKELDNELGITTEQGKASRRVILSRLCQSEILERDPQKDGRFRLVDNSAPLIEWESADPENIVNIKFPFRLESLVRIYKKNIIIIAGSFNAGKTAFCLDFIALNMHNFPIVYYSSEMGAEEMKVRLNKFTHVKEWCFEARERSSNFVDIIKPDKINIIDYLEITDNFHLIAEELMGIFNRLKGGIAIVAIQKKQGAEMGRGAEFSLEKPRLYLSMDPGVLKIVKAKNWADPEKNPNGMSWTFQLVGGAKFVNIIKA